MGRLRKHDEDAERRQLSKPAKASHDWGPVVDAITADPARRAALLAELAKLDELEVSYRRYALRGNAGAGRLMLDTVKYRAKLIGLATRDAAPLTEGEIDVPTWTPAQALAGPASEPSEPDDAEHEAEAEPVKRRGSQ